MLGLWACGDGGQGPGAGLPAHLEVAGGGQTGTVGRVLGDPIVARVTDTDGRGVPGVPVTFAATEGHGVFTPKTRSTDERGEAQAAWSLGPGAGTLRATVTVEGLVSEQLSAVAVAGAAARLAFDAIPEGASVGLAFDPPVAVAVEDEFGNVVPSWSAEILLRLNQGTLGGPASVRAANGRATFPGLHIDQPGAGYVLTATADGLPPVESAAFPVASGAVAQIQVAAGEGQDAAAGSAVAIAPTVVLRDAGGNPIAGAGVTFTVTGGGGTVTPGTAVTGADGRAAPAEWILGTTVGENTLRASPAALPDASVTFTAGSTPGPVDPSRSTVSATPETILTGATSIVEVTAVDAFGNPIPGLAVELTAGGSGNTLVQPPATDANGRASGSFRSSNTGTRTVSAVAGSVALAQQATIVVEPAPTAAAVQVSPAEAGLLVDQTAQLTATVLDDQNQPIEGAVVTWSSDDPQVAGVDAAGVVTARSPGSATITATSDGESGSALVSVSLGEGTLTGVTYCTIGGVEDKMDVYIPSAAMPRPLPVAVHVHGGGWVSGSRSTGNRFAEVKQALLDRGYLVVSLDYRLAPAHKYPSQIQDVKCAIRHLRARAWRYGLDPGHIGAWGGSAGGQLVALLGTADAGVGFDNAGGFQGESSEVQAVIALSAITDFTSPDELRDDYGRVFRTWPDPDSPEMIEASPVTHVTAGDAPFFFIVGDEDQLVLPAQSERMNQRLQAAGVTSSLLRVLHADHDLQSTGAPIDPGFETIKTRMTEFFDQHLR
jgi:acetyl esterase/lipase/protocatechuate 3,4-dioxygenase beta subunit